MKKLAVLMVFFGVLLAFLLSTPAQAQATRTWVSGVGDDANPCNRTAPCKTFAGAISKTAAGGIINCVDPGGYGAVTITKSITIDCTNTMAGVLAAGTNAINVNGAGANVILRGLDIEGVGTGLIGINFTQGASLLVDSCNIYGFQSGAAQGIRFVPSAGGQLVMLDSVIWQTAIAWPCAMHSRTVPPSEFSARPSDVPLDIGAVSVQKKGRSVSLTASGRGRRYDQDRRLWIWLLGAEPAAELRHKPGLLRGGGRRAARGLSH